MKTIRTKFVEDFGEDLAIKLESAAEKHSNEINNKDKGDDPFKWVLLICIGYQCFEIDSYRKYHDIKEASFEQLKKWIRNNADLGSHKGDCDYLALFVGRYKPFIKRNENNS